jgi:hypothetical protein
MLFLVHSEDLYIPRPTATVGFKEKHEIWFSSNDYVTYGEKTDRKEERASMIRP